MKLVRTPGAGHLVLEFGSDCRWPCPVPCPACYGCGQTRSSLGGSQSPFRQNSAWWSVFGRECISLGQTLPLARPGSPGCTHNQPLLWTGPRRVRMLSYSSARPARRVAGHRASIVMQQVNGITLTFGDNGRLHGDLVLRIGPHEWRCDSYFLWCEDPRSGPDRAPVVRRVLAKLIAQWVGAVESLQPGRSCFLPFDFSDQSTRWLRCTLDPLAGSELTVQPGWSEIEGWSFAPSDVGELLADVSDFKAEGTPVAIARSAMLASISGTAAAA